MKTAQRYIIALLLPIFLIGCLPPNPGEDKLVIKVEQTLKGSTIIYDEGMDWYEQNYLKLSEDTKNVFKFVHKNFPDTYRATDSALQLYKAGKTNDLSVQFDALQKLLISLTTLVKANGGPDLVVNPPVKKENK